MATELHWVEGPWPGKLALASRPRGGDWIDDEMAGWRQRGIDVVLSLLTPEEEEELDLKHEAPAVQAGSMEFISLPIPDRGLPGSEAKVAVALEKIDAALSSGENVVVHCRQGIGRTGLIAACLLISRGLDPGAAVARLTSARGISVPETSEQRQWIDHFAAVQAATK